MENNQSLLVEGRVRPFSKVIMDAIATQIQQNPTNSNILESLVHHKDKDYVLVVFPFILTACARVELRGSILTVVQFVLHSIQSLPSHLQFNTVACGLEAIAVCFDSHCVNAIVCLDNCFPHIFTTLSVKLGDLKYWNILSLLKHRIDQLTGSQPNLHFPAIHFLSQVIVCQSEGEFLDKIMPGHPYMIKSTLIQESNAILNRFLVFFAQIDHIKPSASLLCAYINAMFVVVKNCPQYSLACTHLLVQLREKDLLFLTEFGKRSVYRNLKVALLSCYSIPATSSLDDSIEQILLGFSVHPHQLQMKQKIKRKLEKGEKLEQEKPNVPLPMMPNATQQVLKPLLEFDGPLEAESELATKLLARGISTFPPHHLIPIIIKCIQERDEMLFQADVLRYVENPAFDPTYVASGRNADESDEEDVDLMDIDIDSILQSVHDLDVEEQQEQIQDAVTRILEMDSFFNATLKVNQIKGSFDMELDTLVSSRFGWMLIVSRMLTRGPTAFPKKQVVNFIMKDFHKRMDLAIFWLFEEYSRNDLIEYSKWLLEFLEATKQLDPKDRIFTRFVVEVPDLNQDALDFIHLFCKDVERISLGITTLRDLCIYRPAVRSKCLEWLFELASDLDAVTRATACAALKRFVVNHETISLLVIQFATRSISKLFRYRPRQHDGEAVEGEQAFVTSKLELYLIVCSVKPDLLPRLFDMIPEFEPWTMAILNAIVTPLFEQMPSRELLEMISVFPKGSEELALTLIKALLRDEEVCAEVIETTRITFIERDLDVRFLNLIITSLDKDNVLKHLVKIIQSLDESEEQTEMTKNTFMAITEIKQGLNDEQPRAVVTPAELLIRIHNLEDQVGLQKALQASNICFSMPDVFKQEVLAIVLSQLSEQSKLPTLFMRSVIQSLTAFKGLSSFVNGILARLISKQVWKRPKLWDGFIRVVQMNFPSSLQILLTLPKIHGLDVLKQSPKLLDQLQEYLDNIPTHQKSRREVGQLETLVKQTRL